MSRDINDLLPTLREQFTAMRDAALERLGLRIILTNTLRREEEQKAYYAQGREPLDKVNARRAIANLAPITEAQNRRTITRAASAATSWHGYGLAFDIAITNASGKQIVWDASSDWNSDGVDDWAQVGALADELGLEWGGNFSSIYDAPHYQNRLGLTLAQARAKYPPGKVIA